MSDNDDSHQHYQPDPRLAKAYQEANSRSREFLESVCPNYLALSTHDTRYQQESLLGKGALKEVYRSYDSHTQRWVALARLLPERDVPYYDLFVRESWLISSLSHPNIIKVHDTGIDEDGRPFFTMDLKGNTSLADLIKSPQRNLHQLLAIFSKICDAMAYAHAQHTIHLDLKPANIQCDAFGEVLVCDWGLGKRLDNPDDLDSLDTTEKKLKEGLTAIGRIQGSPGYMAPEQTIPGKSKDERTDIYSLGCILHAILTGKAPFQGSPEEIIALTQKSHIPSLQKQYPKQNIPTSLEAVVIKALARKPQERYPSVASLQQDIHQYLAGYATQAEQPGFFREARLFFLRNRLPSSIALASLLIGTIGTVLSVQNLREQRSQTQAERIRANQLSFAVDTLHSEYDALTKDTQTANQNMAASLIQASSRLKHYGIFDQPLETVEQAEKLIHIALKLNPNSKAAHHGLIAQNCLKLNYQKALQINKKYPRNKYDVELARAFPHFAFSRTHIPSTEQLVEFFDKAREIDLRQVAHLERILTYQHALKPNRPDMDRVVLPFLQYLNYHKKPNISITYQSNTATLSLSANQGIKLRIRGENGSQQCILRFIPCKSLQINIRDKFNLKNLEGLAIESLDLSQCSDIHLRDSLSLPHLNTIIIGPGQTLHPEIKKRIESLAPFTVIEK